MDSILTNPNAWLYHCIS